jgi:hypothetical protein
MSTVKSSSEDLTLNADGSGNDVVIQSNGTTKAIVTAEGNVGIGTTSFSYGKLEVADSGYVASAVRSTDASGAIALLAANSSSEVRMGAISNHPLSIRTNNTERMRINADGIVDVLGGTIELNGNEINGVEVTIADDAFSTITPTGRYGGYLSISAQTHGVFPQHQYSAFLFSDFGDSPSSAAVNTGVNFNTSTAGAPTGTTGTDGKVTLFLGGTSGTYYLENRIGSTHTFQITLI